MKLSLIFLDLDQNYLRNLLTGQKKLLKMKEVIWVTSSSAYRELDSLSIWYSHLKRK